MNSKIDFLLGLIKKRPPGNILVSTEYGSAFRSAVQRVSLEFERDLSLKDFPDLQISASRGANSTPLIAWVAITPRGKTVSTWHSVGVCFDIEGKGFVSGIMWSPQGDGSISQPPPSVKKALKMRIDTSRPSTSYSGKFVDPKEWPGESYSYDGVIQHLKTCLKTLKR